MAKAPSHARRYAHTPDPDDANLASDALSSRPLGYDRMSHTGLQEGRDSGGSNQNYLAKRSPLPGGSPSMCLIPIGALGGPRSRALATLGMWAEKPCVRRKKLVSYHYLGAHTRTTSFTLEPLVRYIACMGRAVASAQGMRWVITFHVTKKG